MSTAAATPQSARALARDRRRQAWSRNWRTFRSHRAGLIGLGILAGFFLVAILAPVIAPAEGLEVTKATGGVLEPPSSEYWLGTDDKGRSVLTLLIWGARISLFVGLAATLISMVIGTLIGLTSGYFGGWTGAVLFRAHRVVPGDPVPAAGHRDGHRAGPVAGEHRHRDRGDLVAGHRPAHPGADADASASGRTSNARECSAPAPATRSAGTSCPT